MRGATDADGAPAEIALPADTPQDRVGIARRFVAAIRAGERSPAPSFDDGVRVQALLDACATAARGDGWVRVQHVG